MPTFKRLQTPPESDDRSASGTVTIYIEGEPARVPVGESVAAAVLASSLGYTRTTSISHSLRAPFCLMGICHECLMVIDGQPNRRACQCRVAQGMCIERQDGEGPEPGR
jgi:predicted molibdopterin-dependent oxidoreductase YjgC